MRILGVTGNVHNHERQGLMTSLCLPGTRRKHKAATIPKRSTSRVEVGTWNATEQSFPPDRP